MSHIVTFDSLTFDRLLGKGQFGAVHQGTLNGTEQVAIKKILQPLDERVPYEENIYLQREVDILQSLKHPHVLRFRGICQEEGALYIITEFADGGDLRNYLKNNEPSWDQRIRIALQIAQAIQYLHSRNIVHRDIKTENVLMDKDLVVKIADFGFAREVDSKSPNNYTFCGSEFFEAPEIMFCMDYDERIDIFSYGLVLCELISRKSPSMNYFKRIVPGFGISPDEIRSLTEPGCPEILLTVACECCSDNPDHRPGLDLVISDLKYAYKELTDHQYVDLRSEEDVLRDQELARKEAEYWEELRMAEEEEAKRERIMDEINQRLTRDGSSTSLAQLTADTKESMVAVSVGNGMNSEKGDNAAPIILTEAKIVVGLGTASIRIKPKSANLKPPEALFSSPPPSLDQQPKKPISNPQLLPSEQSPDPKNGDYKKTMRGSPGGSSEPEIIRIGKTLLNNKYVQRNKEDLERWSRFVVGLSNNIPVSDRQIRVLGRIRTYRKCFTAEEVLITILELENEIKTKKQALDLADIMVKLTFFFPVAGGGTFKEKALYRFHADEVKFQESNPKNKQRPASTFFAPQKKN